MITKTKNTQSEWTLFRLVCYCRLEEAGQGVGARMLEVLSYRDKGNRREIRLQGILQFINTNVWRCLFGKSADSLEIYNGGGPVQVESS
jgi:hypothetical protein